MFELARMGRPLQVMCCCLAMSAGAMAQQGAVATVTQSAPSAAAPSDAQLAAYHSLFQVLDIDAVFRHQFAHPPGDQV